MITTIAPGLTLTDEMYEAAEAGVARFAPGVRPLSREVFTDPALWWLIPDNRGDCYKAEFTLLKTRERTIKVNRWFLPDLRGGDVSQPHSHPWDFDAHLLAGGYAEDRHTPTELGVVSALDVHHAAGQVNRVPRHVYHEVTSVEPGTLSLMVCGPGERGAWGYLDIATGEHKPVVADPDFAAKLAALNPHQQAR